MFGVITSGKLENCFTGSGSAFAVLFFGSAFVTVMSHLFPKQLETLETHSLLESGAHGAKTIVRLKSKSSVKNAFLGGL